MVIDAFELQVSRGLAYLTPEMTRTLNSKVRVAHSAEETWRLRCNYALEEHIAELGKRKLLLVEEETVAKGTADEQTQRLVRCELVGEHLGGLMLGAITSKDLASEISSTFFRYRFDEDHGASFAVEMVKVMLNVHISGHQWCVAETETSCYLCTRIKMSVQVPGVGTLIEMHLERQMRASHDAFPKHVDAYLMAQRESAARDLVRESPQGSPGLELSKLQEPPALGLPECFVHAATTPRRSRCQLVASVLGWTFIGLRRHRILEPPAGSGSHAVVVKVSPRSARLLLLCGCASVLQDEIVE